MTDDERQIELAHAIRGLLTTLEVGDQIVIERGDDGKSKPLMSIRLRRGDKVIVLPWAVSAGRLCTALVEIGSHR